MQANLFGKFLLRKGLLSESELQHAIDLQRASHPLLGELAVRLSMLSPEQVELINQKQILQDKRFGDIAQGEGLLSAMQMEELLRLQKQEHKYIGTILVEEGYLDSEQLLVELELHQQSSQDAFKALNAAIEGHPQAEVLLNSIDFFGKLFLRMLKVHCHLKCLLRNETLETLGNSVHIPVQAIPPFVIGLASNDQSRINIASRFMGITPEECDSVLAEDGMGELLNIILGQMLNETMPQVLEAQRMEPDFSCSAAELLQRGEQSLAVEMSSELGSFVIIVAGKA
ncbi:hypothetical protein [Motiliproteus sp. MSK22-1]|uniref:hypothetical protein n=1 Tax=Motiliproteus sp. MSK22-1 TaxID=1897630 RepID=UPI000977BFAA|nr:hypothetical protein [Motiliproteus sp. MSK22-1]OMH33905.1 hypothetical protein BGP75_13070 [Motiliproteus sp. MSK22-1]